MATRAALPVGATTITPGYSWRLDLDVKFDGERPDDWPDWQVRMHIWADGVGMTIQNGAGVTFEEVPVPGEVDPVVLPVIRLSTEQTESLRDSARVHYVIDLRAPAGEAEDYFAGPMTKAFGPPAGLLA